jgi:hypothetical protein
MYATEVWTLTKSVKNNLAMWERKIMRRIFGAVKENVAWRIGTNQELMTLYGKPDIISGIKKED